MRRGRCRPCSNRARRRARVLRSNGARPALPPPLACRGCLDICQAIIVVAIKLWVHREGGMPDGGRNPTNKRVQARAARLAAAAAGGATAA